MSQLHEPISVPFLSPERVQVTSLPLPSLPHTELQWPTTPPPLYSKRLVKRTHPSPSSFVVAPHHRSPSPSPEFGWSTAASSPSRWELAPHNIFPLPLNCFCPHLFLPLMPCRELLRPSSSRTDARSIVRHLAIDTLASEPPSPYLVHSPWLTLARAAILGTPHPLSQSDVARRPVTMPRRLLGHHRPLWPLGWAS
jgi:hypothetical protein